MIFFVNGLRDRKAEKTKLEADMDLNLDVASSLDAFVSLEEIDPDLNWQDVLADTWGIPHCSSKD